MKKTFLTRMALIFTGLAFFSQSCTDLDEELFDTVTSENFFQTDEEFVAALGQAYSSFSGLGSHANLWAINELSSDELVVATKGGDWFDGGILIQLHQHEATPDNGFFNNAWTQIYSGINNCNRLIFQFQQLEDNPQAAAFIAELRGLRALWFYWAMDAFGNVPLTTDFTQTGNPATASRQEVFNFIESELNAIVDLLPAESNSATYGRMNRWAALALRARLYLNAEVYTGTPRYSDAAADAEAIMNSGLFSLAGNYAENFAVENSGSPENIFVIPYDKVFATGFNWNAMTLHYASQGVFQFTFQPWNGYAVVEEFYNSYIDSENNPGPQGPVWSGLAEFDPANITPNGTGTLDRRLSNFIVGPQVNPDGSIAVDPAFEATDPDGTMLNFTPEINEIFPNGWRQGGARNGKYEFEQGGTENLDNDFVIFRLGEMMLIKAEADYRMGNTASALAIVNQIRERAGVDPFTELNDENLLAERGREMFAEMTRRQDLIRFGRFQDAWWEKDASSATFNIFPIPQPQLDANPSLQQNPGYN